MNIVKIIYIGKRLAAVSLIVAATYYFGGEALQGVYDGFVGNPQRTTIDD